MVGRMFPLIGLQDRVVLEGSLCIGLENKSILQKEEVELSDNGEFKRVYGLNIAEWVELLTSLDRRWPILQR